MFHGLREHTGGVGEEGKEDIQAFVDRARVAREVHDERAGADDGDATGEDREGRFLESLDPEGNGDTRDFAFGDVAGGLGGDVARRKAGAARGDHDVGDGAIAPGTQLFCDGESVIRKHVPCGEQMPGGGDARGGEVAADILASTGSALIGTGEDGDANHGCKHT